jgi:transposase-like protein
MIKRCPTPACPSLQFRKYGTYRRLSDGKSVKRWMCTKCKLHFSSATFQKPYRQHKRRVNSHVLNLLSSGVSMRRIALLLAIHRTTVARKLAYLARLAEERQSRLLATLPKVREVQFDDLLTLEHTKCKPLSISLAVEAPTRRILGFEVSRIPASGPLAEISRLKYGPRPNQRPRGLRRLLGKVRGALHAEVIFRSDEDSLYPAVIRRRFPEAVHLRHPGRRGCITGQGELKKLRFDPLFSLNHTCAMLRANVNRLFRRTWCTTKKPDRLVQHLTVYMDFHNRVLLGVGRSSPGNRRSKAGKSAVQQAQHGCRPVNVGWPARPPGTGTGCSPA